MTYELPKPVLSTTIVQLKRIIIWFYHVKVHITKDVDFQLKTIQKLVEQTEKINLFRIGNGRV
jgi:hypothetical protein